MLSGNGMSSDKGVNDPALGEYEKAVERDTFLSPEAAKGFGLIDEVVTSRPLSDDDDDE